MMYDMRNHETGDLQRNVLVDIICYVLAIPMLLPKENALSYVIKVDQCVSSS